MTTKILGTQIEAGTIQTEQLANNFIATFANSSQLSALVTTTALSNFTAQFGPKVSSVAIANSSFIVLDDTAVNTGGGYIVVTGNNFQSGATVLIDNTPATAVSVVNDNILNVQVPAKAAATYNLYVVNPDGGTGIRVNAVTYSVTPTWVTASPLLTISDTANNIATFNRVLNATGATSYALANGSSLPDGTQLLANGYFYGTLTISSNTTYSFDVIATDAENQDSVKSFQQPVAYTPLRVLFTLSDSSTEPTLYAHTGVGRTANNWNKIDTSDFGTGAVRANGSLWTWGINGSGQLGLLDRVSRDIPTRITGVPISDNDWGNVFAGTSASMYFQKTGFSMWSSGENTSGQLGVGDRVNRSFPTQVGGLGWPSVAAGRFLAIFRRESSPRYLAFSGVSNNGSNGDDTGLSPRSTPTQVDSQSWTDVKLGYQNSALGTRAGSLYSWGNTGFGQAGRNVRAAVGANNSSPIQVGALTNWSQIACGDSHALATRTDGTLWSWGNNDVGQLGHDNTILRSSPVQIGSGIGWSKVSTKYNYNLALKTDGTLWSWGNTRSSPVQIGTDDGWVEIAAGRNDGYAIRSF
jgi:alpha-tubulin suppressor-like RCC1 family protein